MKPNSSLHLVTSRAVPVLVGFVCFSSAGAALASTKDVVLDRLHPVVVVAGPPASDAMAVSVLQESPDGTLRSRGMDAQMWTGDRLRIKVTASREGKLSIYNTTPLGEFKPESVWTGTVRPGEEAVSPRMALTNQSGGGVEQLHVVLEPVSPPSGAWAWVRHWLGSVGEGVRSTVSKDVVLDVEHTSTTTYLLNARGQGLVTTLRVAHR